MYIFLCKFNSLIYLFFCTQDPKILHPVAVRVTPGIDNCVEDQEKEILSNNVEEMVLIKSIQRPQAKKLSRMYLLIIGDNKLLNL